MENSKFKKVFELSQKLQEKNDRKLYDELSKIDDKMESFEEFIENERKESEKEISEERKKRVEDAYISKDKIVKDTLTFDLYLFHHTRIDPIEFDENYKPLPLNEKEIYEYGAVVSMEDEKGYYNISGVFGGVEEDDHFAKDKYNALKTKIQNTSEDELLDDIEKQILKQINE